MDDDTKKVVNDDAMVNENDESADNIDTQEESMQDSVKPEETLAAETPDATNITAQDPDEIPGTWIEVKDGKFVCSECENESAPETNTVDGTVAADTEKIKTELIEKPTKITYGSCPVCGMEYVFKAKNDKLYMEPSDMLK